MPEIGKVIGQEMPLVGVSRVHRGVSHPVGMEFIVTEHLGVAAEAIDVTCARRVLLALLVGAAVMDQASQRLSRGSTAAALSTLVFRAGTADKAFLACGTRTRVLGRGRLVAGVRDLSTTQ